MCLFSPRYVVQPWYSFLKRAYERYNSYKNKKYESETTELNGIGHLLVTCSSDGDFK